MAKFKPVRKKQKTPTPRGGTGCIILLLLGLLLAVLFVILWMKYAAQS